jgi:hypothetical protein
MLVNDQSGVAASDQVIMFRATKLFHCPRGRNGGTGDGRNGAGSPIPIYVALAAESSTVSRIESDHNKQVRNRCNRSISVVNRVESKNYLESFP